MKITVFRYPLKQEGNLFGRLKKGVRRNGHLAIQSLVRTVIGSDVIVMMLTQENTMKEEKMWDL